MNTNTNQTVSDNIGPPRSSAKLTSKIEITISCEDLLNLEVISKSDPLCIVKIKEEWHNHFFEDYLEIGRTEQISDNLNPEWVKKFVVNYNFETVQNMRFEIWDKDPTGNDLLGEYETTLAEIVSFSGRQFRGKLKNKRSDDAGFIVIVAEELSSCRDRVEMTFQAIECEKQRWFKRNDPFLVFSRLNEDGTFSVVFKTEVVHSSKHPKWKPFTISERKLCNRDQHRPIKIDCFDERIDGDHKLIGTCQTSLCILKKGVGKDNQYQLMENDKSKDSTGTLELKSIIVKEEFSFLDYIRGGTQMHFAVAIDFTASNGSPMDPRSLHYLSEIPNSYEIALRSVGEIIQHYDTSHMYPAFGFGAKLPLNEDVSHQFPLNGNLLFPFCADIQEMLTHYRNTLASVQLSGPTYFSPVINNTIEISKQYQDGRHYFVLLIITEGSIADMQQTIRSIISASKLPISIIIVGVGNTDFSAMDLLDSDDKRLSLDGVYAERDVVQFVPLNRFLEHGSFLKSQADLAKAVLAEIPNQMKSYMKTKGFKPQVIRNSSKLPMPIPSAPVG